MYSRCCCVKSIWPNIIKTEKLICFNMLLLLLLPCQMLFVQLHERDLLLAIPSALLLSTAVSRNHGPTLSTRIHMCMCTYVNSIAVNMVSGKCWLDFSSKRELHFLQNCCLSFIFSSFFWECSFLRVIDVETHASNCRIATIPPKKCFQCFKLRQGILPHLR